MEKQIQLKEILIHWAEGSTAKYDKFPQIYKTYEEANKALLPVLVDAMEDDCYNKVKYTAFFEDGETYQGRLDISSREDNPAECTNVIGKSITNYLNFSIKEDNIYFKLDEISRKEAIDFLNNYNLK